MRWVHHVAHMREKTNSYRVLMGKRGGKRSLERLRYKLEDNIEMDVTEIRWYFVDCLYLVQNRDKWWVLVNTVMSLWVLYNAGNF